MVSLMLKQPETDNQINRVTFLTAILPMDFMTVFFTVYAIINQYSYY